MAPNLRLLCAALVLCVICEVCEGHTEDNTTCNVALDSLIRMDNDYFLAFQIEAGSNESAFDYYFATGKVKDGVESLVKTSQPCNCRDSWNPSCSFRRHFRSRILDEWDDLHIDRVRVSVYDGKVEKRFIEFDGAGSNATNWFSPSRIVSSSYPNIRNGSFFYFSIDGYCPYNRRFFISTFHGDCDKDGGYLVVVDSTVRHCPWETPLPSYPIILYSMDTKDVRWNTDGVVGRADALVISVSLNTSCNA